MITPRTRWAELHVENFIAPAFVAEFVFRSPQVMDRDRPREVADLLITRAEQALLVSQKCQEDPNVRTGDKLERWARKSAEAAVKQLKGALRRVGDGQEIWCDHRRRGRVPFPNGLPAINHAIATVEVFERIELQDDLLLDSLNMPISYLSVNDFLNLCDQLRTVPEMVRYLDARRSLPKAALLSLGAERTIFEYYLLHDGTFSGFTSIDDAERTLSQHQTELIGIVEGVAEREFHSKALEHVADQLAGRHPQYADGLSQAVLDHYEPTGERRGYLVMQDLIAGLTLGERAELGRRFLGACQLRRSGNGKGLTHMAAMVSSHPDYVLVLGSFGATERTTRNALLSRFEPLATAAMAHYDRTRCFIVFDRDGESYEVAVAQRTHPPTAEELENGRKAFGSLAMSTQNVRVRPD